MGWIIALIIFGIGGLGYWMHARQPHGHQTEHWLPRNSSENNADKGVIYDYQERAEDEASIVEDEAYDNEAYEDEVYEEGAYEEEVYDDGELTEDEEYYVLQQEEEEEEE